MNIASKNMIVKEKLTAKDYVQDGLIAMWDGIENAGWGVHDSNATVWKDLVGLRTFQLTSNVKFGEKSLNYKSSSGSWINSVIDRIEDGIATIECVFRTTGGNEVIASFAYDGVYKYTRYIFSSNGTISFSDGQCMTTCQAGDHSVSCRFENGSSFGADSCFVDGIDSGFGRWEYWTCRQFTAIGSGYSDSLIKNPLKGRIYNIRLYSKRLTDADVAANYAIDKARFNLR